MSCVAAPVVRLALLWRISLLALKSVLKDANVMMDLFLMETSVSPWRSVGVCLLADI